MKKKEGFLLPGCMGRMPGLNIGCPGGNGRIIRIRIIMRGCGNRPLKPGGGLIPGRIIMNGGRIKAPGGPLKPGGGLNPGRIIKGIRMKRPRGPPRKLSCWY